MLVTAVVAFTVSNGIYPVLFNLYLLRLEYSVEFVGLANAIGLLSFGLVSLPSSALANRWGTRKAMVNGIALITLCYALIPLVEFMPEPWRRPWILGNRVVALAGLALFMVNAMPFLSGATKVSGQNYAYSARGMIDTLAGFFGSLIGGLLPGWLSPVFNVATENPAAYRYALLLGAFLCIPAVPVLLAIRKPYIPHKRTKRESTTINPAPVTLIAIMGLAVMLRTSGIGAVRTFFNVYLDDGLGIPTAQIGLLFGIVQLMAAPAAIIMPPLAKRWGNYRVIIAGTLGLAISILPIALIPHSAAATLGRLGIYICGLISETALNAFQMDLVVPRWRAAMAGTATMVVGLSWTALSLGGGYMITALSYQALFLTAAVLTSAGSLCFWAYFRKPRGALAAPPQRGQED